MKKTEKKEEDSEMLDYYEGYEPHHRKANDLAEERFEAKRKSGKISESEYWKKRDAIYDSIKDGGKRKAKRFAKEHEKKPGTGNHPLNR